MNRKEISLSTSWRDDLNEECRARVEKAVEQLAADERYEALEGRRLGDTLGHLDELRQRAIDFIATVDKLSPVGMAAMNDAGERRRVYTGRHKLWDLQNQLREVAMSAEEGAQLLIHMHSTWPESGQGTGSAMGRDSDLRAIRVDHDQHTDLPPFRSPKDKFAVQVISVLIRAGFDPRLRGATKILEKRLEEIWLEFRNDRPPNWTRVIKARHAIAVWVARKLAAEAVWKPVVEKRNATLRKTGKITTGGIEVLCRRS